jgi:hypothetical protein
MRMNHAFWLADAARQLDKKSIVIRQSLVRGYSVDRPPRASVQSTAEASAAPAQVKAVSWGVGEDLRRDAGFTLLQGITKGLALPLPPNARLPGMHACVHVRICVCTNLCTYVCICMHVCMYLCVYTCMCKYLSRFVCRTVRNCTRDSRDHDTCIIISNSL